MGSAASEGVQCVCSELSDDVNLESENSKRSGRVRASHRVGVVRVSTRLKTHTRGTYSSA